MHGNVYPCFINKNPLFLAGGLIDLYRYYYQETPTAVNPLGPAIFV